MAIVTLAPLGAGAADLPPAPPGPAVYAPPAAYRAVANWGGFYVGGNVGINFARDRSTFSVGGMPFSTVDRVWRGWRRSGRLQLAIRSWGPKPILTGPMRRAASVPNAESAGR
jgi:hypothetical protein